MKNKIPAQVNDVDIEWISAVFCQILNKGMFSCENLNEFVIWNRSHYMLCEDYVTCSCSFVLRYDF